MKLRSLCILFVPAFAMLGLTTGSQQAGLADSADTSVAAEDDAAPERSASNSRNADSPDDGYGGYPEALVVTEDGQWIRGGLKFQSDEQVILVIAGIDLTLDQRDIRRLELLPSLEERYRTRRRQIDDSDHERRLDLVEWLVRNEAFEWALEEAAAVLDADSDNQRARRLFYTIGARITLLSESRRAKREETGRLTMAQLYSLLPDNRISDEDVNLLRVYEVDLDDPPRMVIPRAVRDRLVQRYTGDALIPDTRSARAVFMQQSPAAVLDVMFRLGAREFYGDVRVLEHPTSLKSFRDDIHRRWLMSSCGTTRCHGGLEAGRFFLHTRERGSDRTIYSNFLTIERFRTTDGEPLLDYDQPERSRLLHMGLPRDIAIFDHPEVEGWRPVFRDQNDRNFRAAVEWINSLYRPRPDHPIEYEPPIVKPLGHTENGDDQRRIER